MITIIAILSLIDIVCTYTGISMGAIQEGNPLIAYGFEWSIIGTCTIALILIGISLYIINKYMKEYKWIRYVLIPVLLTKVYIVFLHIQWIYWTI